MPETIDEKQTLPLAIVSLVLGFLSCVMFLILTAIPAVICGHISLSRLKYDPTLYNKNSKSIAIAGIFLGYLGIIISVVIVANFFMVIFDWGGLAVIPTK